MGEGALPNKKKADSKGDTETLSHRLIVIKTLK